MANDWTDEVDRDDSLSDESYHHRELYAQFGLAIYMAQVLEMGVINLLSVMDALPQAKSQEEYDTLVSELMTRTLGKTIRRLRVLLPDEPELCAKLEVALNKRNYMAHRFWREKVQLVATAKGRNRLISELIEARELFEGVDRQLDEILFAHASKGGPTRESVRDAVVRERELMVALDGHLPDELPTL
ncbi:hypothetical protein [Pseudonocardia sp. WMMC193]|uniref:hypothetical protein n=1 Tax=Pseudonocardia sp. WMMC193 TaxID=2911965 RepID=UPI001F4654D8|nr:hypothetical protein [Pseudonocardia sp. WMMC193]MCF7553778.1 hypothetical protein [Pseudonocardia sp. WMMC193]